MKSNKHGLEMSLTKKKRSVFQRLDCISTARKLKWSINRGGLYKVYTAIKQSEGSTNLQDRTLVYFIKHKVIFVAIKPISYSSFGHDSYVFFKHLGFEIMRSINE